MMDDFDGTTKADEALADRIRILAVDILIIKIEF